MIAAEKNTKGGSYEFIEANDHSRLLERIAKVREAKIKKRGNLNNSELDVVLEPQSEWEKFDSELIAAEFRAQKNASDESLAPVTHQAVEIHSPGTV